jgi:HAD superfamily hydrolase (TIGR01509 family)
VGSIAQPFETCGLRLLGPNLLFLEHSSGMPRICWQTIFICGKPPRYDKPLKQLGLLSRQADTRRVTGANSVSGVPRARPRAPPEAHETLDRLKELDLKLALITNGVAEPQRAKVVRFALEHRFDHIQIECEHGFGKPEERAYKHAMEVLGVGPQETWMVGDNLEWEIVAPQRLGIYAVWHDAYGVGLPADSPIRPDRIIRRLSELLV